jgi:hypothetical protein
MIVFDPKDAKLRRYLRMANFASRSRKLSLETPPGACVAFSKIV